ncbi:MAG: putative PEP-binding protein [Microcoleaceae cyanobacterium]
MDNFYWLHQIQNSDRDIVGNQGLYLSRLIHDHPVRSGVVLPAQELWHFLETIDWREPLFVDLSHSSLHLDVSNSQNLQRIAQGICHHILTAPTPSAWLNLFSEILQSSSVTAVTFQGYLSGSEIKTEGILDPIWTGGNPTAMATGLKLAIAEFFHAKSLFYWDYSGRTLQQLQPTILIQPFYSVTAAGIIQVHDHQWEIQATPGLNLSIDWGQTEPDSYYIHPQTLQVQAQNLGHKTIAYYLKSSARESVSQAEINETHHILPQTAQLADSPLQAEIVPPQQQTAWVLETTQLHDLIQLTQRARTQLGQSCQLRWMFGTTSPEVPEQFYWYFINPLTTVSTSIATVSDKRLTDQSTDATTEHQILSGLGVSGGIVVAKTVVISSTSSPDIQLQPESILVLPKITSEYFPLLKQAVGIIAELGSMTGHGAILARELGIPAVLGVRGATQQIQTGEFVLIEGEQGEVHLLGTEEPTEAFYSDLNSASIELSKPTTVAINTHLMVNISQPNSIERLQNLPIDGIGLLRSELLALDVLPVQKQNQTWNFQQWLQPQFQSEFIQRMADSLRSFTVALAPKPIFYRALDLREFYSEVRPFWGETDWEYIHLRQRLHHHESSDNSDNKTLFDLELAVLSQLYQWGYENVNLILPMVRSVEEFSVYQYWVKQAKLTENATFKLWIMAEVPSVLFLLPDYVKAGVEGVAIGTNDLTQFMLGIDRNNNEHLTHLNASHSAVTAAIRQIIQMAKSADIPCCICGDAPVLYPELIQEFIRWGVTSLSVHPEAVQSTYHTIIQAERRLLVEEIRRQFNA